MTTVQLPQKFQPHPEQATGIITLDQARMMILSEDLSYEGACFLLPPSAWSLLPKQSLEAQNMKAKQPILR